MKEDVAQADIECLPTHCSPLHLPERKVQTAPNLSNLTDGTHSGKLRVICYGERDGVWWVPDSIWSAYARCMIQWLSKLCLISTVGNARCVVA